jgi:Zn-dependent metalloprotease
MSECSHFHPIHCILPPYMLTQIAAHGTPEQQSWAQRTLAITSILREQREMIVRGAAAAEKTIVGGKNRVVYTADHGDALPGNKVRGEGEPPVSDPAVNEAYDGAGATYDLYHDVYVRDSVDGEGMRLDSTVHYQNNYDNAFWNGHQMVYGDGDEALPPDQQLFNRFTVAVDVIGHELTHGVTQYTANLIYTDQPGALNESISDVFGILVKQRLLGLSAAESDWLIGKGLLASHVQGVALRSMKAPGTAYDDPILGKDPQPANMKDYQNVGSDNGGVHINSGIPNHAFYIAATNIGGNAWEKAGRIWYVTLRNRLRASSNFQEMADLTYQVGGELFGSGSLEQQAIRAAWSEVGLNIDLSPVPAPVPTTNSGCLAAPVNFILGMGRRLTGKSLG